MWHRPLEKDTCKMTMTKYTNQDYLTSKQYSNTSNLNTRIRLHRRFSINKQGLIVWIFDHIKLPTSSRILELGCGSGDLWLENVKGIPGGWNITLSDLSSGMLEGAQENLRRIDKNIEFRKFDAQKIPYEDEHFDAVIANFMLYHVPDRPRALFEIHRVLKTGGQLYAATNGRNHMRETRELIKSIDPDVDLTSAGELFGLENGHDQLIKYFSKVVMYRYEDELVVTEVEPLVSYILSTQRSAIIEDEPQRVADIIRNEIEMNKAFYITKDAGMFVASKNSRSS